MTPPAADTTAPTTVVTGPLRPLYTDDLIEVVDHWSGTLGSPDARNRAKREGIRVLKHPLLEFLSKAHPVSPIVWTGPFMVWGAWRGLAEAGPLATLGWFALGILFWTLIEYGLHRFVFHWRPAGNAGTMWSFFVHGYHHEFPNDRMRLVAPPFMLFFFGALAILLYSAVFGRMWVPLFGGTCVGYVAYDWIHYYTHHFHPKRGVGAWLRRYHLKHHYQEGNMRYGISSPLWDVVFRTYIGPDK